MFLKNRTAFMQFVPYGMIVKWKNEGFMGMRIIQ